MPQNFDRNKMGMQDLPSPEQVNFFHLSSDKDAGPGALHHTLGINPSQASPGNHTHNGRNSKRISYLDLLDLPTGALAGVVGSTFRNDTAAAVPRGTVVYTAGSNGIHPLLQLAQSNTESTSSKTFGVTYETIAKNAEGLVIEFGLLENLDTSALTEGAAVWLSPTVAGGMTTTKPSAPNHLVLIGFCVRSHNQFGKLFIKVQNGYELDELHNVKITSPTDGQYLRYQASTGLWINSN